MRMLIRLLTALVLTVTGLTVAPAPVACACSCAIRTTAEALGAATAVFRGEVISSSTPSPRSSAEPVRYLVRVVRVYKGDLPSVVMVSSAADGASCGIRLAGKVTVFATGFADVLETTLCAAPPKLDVAVLGPGAPPRAAQPPSASPAATQATAPTETPAPTDTSDGTGIKLFVGLGVTAVVLFAVGWLIGRARH